jgi:DNA-directed RNA polymerase subunit RPC12/RpoP
MSSRKNTIEIYPPKYVESGHTERIDMSGFECPYCGGRGYFMPREIEKDKYEQEECGVCLGAGSLCAHITVQWVASGDHKKTECVNHDI